MPHVVFERGDRIGSLYPQRLFIVGKPAPQKLIQVLIGYGVQKGGAFFEVVGNYFRRKIAHKMADRQIEKYSGQQQGSDDGRDDSEGKPAFYPGGFYHLNTGLEEPGCSGHTILIPAFFDLHSERQFLGMLAGFAVVAISAYDSHGLHGPKGIPDLFPVQGLGLFHRCLQNFSGGKGGRRVIGRPEL
jgi:hypothetical protein